MVNQPCEYDAVLGGTNEGPTLQQGAAVIGITNRYTHPDHKQFCLDMAANQIPVAHYEGRFFWSGPSARVTDIQDVLSNTKVKCLWDAMGKGWIVYPKAYCQEAIIQARKYMNEKNQFPIHDRPGFVSDAAYRRQFEALLQMIEVELGMTPNEVEI
jgi:hypothetical protein